MIRAALAAALVLTVGVGSVAAHECYVVNRSAQGNAGASHSQRWFTLTLEQLFSETEDSGSRPVRGPGRLGGRHSQGAGHPVVVHHPDRQDHRRRHTRLRAARPQQRREGHRPLHRQLRKCPDRYRLRGARALNRALLNRGATEVDPSSRRTIAPPHARCGRIGRRRRHDSCGTRDGHHHRRGRRRADRGHGRHGRIAHSGLERGGSRRRATRPKA